MITVHNAQRDLSLSKGQIKALVQELLNFLQLPESEITLYFVTKKKISELHRDFFQDPSPTDCISFPMDEKDLGEIFVCPAVAIEYAEKKNLDPYEETTLYIIHGLLHLIGFDDLSPKDKRVMRKKEKSCMAHLKSYKMILKAS